MGIRLRIIISGGAALSSAAFLVPVHAQTNAAIASATEVDPGVSDFSFTSGAAGTETLKTSANDAFYFDSVINTPATPTGVNVASSLDSFSAVGGTTTIFGGGFYVVNFTNVSGGLYASSASGAQDFLSFNFTAGTVTANGVTTTTNIQLIYNSAQPSLANFQVSASESPAGAPGLDDFSSQIYNFTNPNAQGQYFTTENFELALNSVSPSPADSGGTLNSFMSNGSFGFNSTPGPTALPEPSALAMAVLGAGVGFVPVLRRKRSKAA